MSKTDKDMPLWVQATRWAPKHHRCQFDAGTKACHRNRECNLAPAPAVDHNFDVIHGRVRYRFPGYWQTSHDCNWVPDLTSIYADRLHWSSPPPKWFVDHVGHNQERRRARDECIEARKEYRATGDIDIIPTVLQHRHQAQWLYW